MAPLPCTTGARADLAKAMHLLTLYCTDPDVVFEPLAVKIDNQSAAVSAFKSTDDAWAYVDTHGFDRQHFVVRELSLDEFEKKRNSIRQGMPGLTLFIQVEE